jgi:membrane-bound lytic murein transglycosylase D
MVKKNLFTCSVFLTLSIVSALFICGVSDSKITKRNNTKFDILTRQKSEDVNKNVTLNFADEAVPVHNAKVKSRIGHSIRKSSANRSETAELKRKAAKWFPIIEPILKYYGIPEDFKYIPMLESGFDNGVVSARGAKGLWQFMPGTAREYGLTVAKGRDDRLNSRKATIAACKYIKELYVQFNSWTLAAAAYNCGSPRVQHAITRKNQGNYFYMTLNRETGSYVYRLVALKQMVNKQPVQATPQEQIVAALTAPETLTYN